MIHRPRLCSATVKRTVLLLSFIAIKQFPTEHRGSSTYPSNGLRSLMIITTVRAEVAARHVVQIPASSVCRRFE